MGWWDLPEWVREELRGKVLSGLSEFISEEIRQAIVRNIVEQALPRWLKFQRELSKYAFDILIAMTCTLSEFPWGHPCYVSFVYPLVYSLAGFVTRPVSTVTVMTMAGYRIYRQVESVLTNPSSLPQGVREVLRRYVGSEETWFPRWRSGFCMLLRDVFTRIISEADITEINYLRQVLMQCLEEATATRRGYLKPRCFTEAGVFRVVVWLIVNLVNNCGWTSYVIEDIEKARAEAVVSAMRTGRAPLEFSESVGYRLRIRLRRPGRK